MESVRQVALVTGGTGGLGSAVSRQLAAEGCAVAIHFAHDRAKAARVEVECRAAEAETLLVQGDVSVDADCRRIVAEVVARWGRLDILINNAAVTKFVPHHDLEGLSAEDFQAIFAVNTIGPFQMVRAAAAALRAGGEGSVVNVSSASAMLGTGSSMAYSASKAGLNTLTLAFARALAPEIRVNAVCPSFIASEWLRNGLGEERYDRLKANVVATTPLHRAATPEDVAESVVWLARRARHVTGEIVVIDGGLRLGPGLASGARS